MIKKVKALRVCLPILKLFLIETQICILEEIFQVLAILDVI